MPFISPDVTGGDAVSISIYRAEHAALVVTALQIEDTNSLLTFRCERAGVPISVHAFDASLSEELLEIGADHLMVSQHDGIRAVENGLRGLGVLG